MKQQIAATVLFLAATAPAFAADTVYHIFADGLVCRYCAFAVDKQLSQLEGVNQIDIYLEHGVINVRMAERSTLSEQQLGALLESAGVTFRRMEQHPAPQ
jgi:copper chaperone CopZ